MEQITIQPDQKLQIHPAAKLMPLMTAEEWTQLKIDIEENGQREPVILYQGQLLDGRNRLKVCRELNIPVRAVSLSEEEDPYLHVASLNLHRRQLTTSQKAVVAAKIMDRIEPEPGQKRRDIAAAAFGVSPKLVQGARKLLQENPKMLEKVFKGEYTINKALRKEAAPKASPAIRIIGELLTLIPSDKRRELEVIQKNAPPNYAVFIGEKIKKISHEPFFELIAGLYRDSLSQPLASPPSVDTQKAEKVDGIEELDETDKAF